jgi:hypothetical protein
LPKPIFEPEIVEPCVLAGHERPVVDLDAVVAGAGKCDRLVEPERPRCLLAGDASINHGCLSSAVSISFRESSHVIPQPGLDRFEGGSI